MSVSEMAEGQPVVADSQRSRTKTAALREGRSVGEGGRSVSVELGGTKKEEATRDAHRTPTLLQQHPITRQLMQRRRPQPFIPHLPRPLTHPILIHPLQSQHRRNPDRLSQAQKRPLMIALPHLEQGQ